ncbi:NADH-cytochrome b5 reductase [Abortiporus biennis]|nr:NADH-cytochrome b5 reductase [Abortiporus biennis]
MPNRFQLAFLASFFGVFLSLVLSYHFITGKLKAAGYDVSKLILIGLEDKDVPLSKGKMPDFNSSTYAQLAALVFTLLTSAFLYFKLGGGKRKPVLDATKWQEFPLKEKIVISHNTAIYRFALPHPEDVLGLPIGQHIQISAHIEGKDIMRSYTPTSSDDDHGYFDLLIKAYEKGNISRYISHLKIGEKIRVKGPKGQFNYHMSLTREIGMIAGGTGITPMLQIIRAALKNPLDRTKISLIYANVTPEDILLKKELDELASQHAHRFKIYYVLNHPPVGWNGGVGFVTKEQIHEHLPPTDHNIKILMCGPPPMMNAMKAHLAELNYPAPRTVSKLGDQVFLF